MFKIMIRDNMAPIAKEILEATGKIEVVVDNDKKNNDPEALSKILNDFDGLAIRSGTKVTEAVLQQAKRLKVIGRAGIGVDNIDVPNATRQGIVVMNAPGGNTVTTGELAISLLMSLARHVPRATASIKAGKWEKKQLIGVEITGKTLGVVGLGNIGRVVAQRAKGLQMKVIATDPFVSTEAAAEIGVELVDLDTLLARSDFITLHVPRLKETVNLINQTTLAKMKNGVRLINCSRGDIVDIDDLHQAVLEGKVAGAALDVYPTEPPDVSHPIFSHQNIIFTPHLGASTGEAQVKVAEMIANQMSAYLLQGVIQNAVNFPSLSKEIMDKLAPYLNLAEKMGSLMGQIVRHKHDITITYSGYLADVDTRPLTNVILKGFLGAFSERSLNYVSAPILAKEKGISVNVTNSQDRTDFTNLICIKLEGHEEATGEIWGTIFARQYPRIVRFGKIYMDAIPEGSMIVIQNYDRPGVIGNVGSTLGKHKINIARFHLGRLEDRAVCMVNIDAPADDQALAEIQALPNIISARQVFLG